VPEPLIEIHVFVQRPVLLANAAALTIGVTMFASFVFMPLFMETPRGMSAATARLADYGFGLTATKAGLTMLSGPLGMLAAGSQAGRIGAWLGMKWPLSAGCLLMGLATASLAIWHAHPWQFVVAQGVIGLGTGLAMGAMPTLITESVRQTETGVANGMNMVVRTVGMVIGAQLGAVFLAAYTIGQSGVPSVTGFEVTFVVGAVCGVVAAALAVFVTPTRRGSRRELALAGSTATHR
jgi:MFS family permease